MFKIFNYLRNPIEIAAMSFIVLITLIALIGPLVAPHDPYEANFHNTFSAPSSEYIFGTDAAGRDVFSRVLFGAKLTLATTLFIIFIVSSIGIFIGIISALSGGIIDNLLMRFTDIWLGFPPLILALGFAASFGAGMKAAILALIFTWWPNYARLSRALIIETKDKEFTITCIGQFDKLIEMYNQYLDNIEDNIELFPFQGAVLNNF